MAGPSRFRIFENPDSACARVAEEIAQLIRERAMVGHNVVLGLDGDKMSLPFLKELIYLHREEGLSLSNVITFNTDEYLGLAVDHPGTMRSFMQRHLFDHVDIPPGNIRFLSGTVSPQKLGRHLADYEARIAWDGGIDYQILGLRQNGCLGMHDPAIPRDGSTTLVRIHDPFRELEATTFDGLDNVPSHTLSLGHHTILKSRKVIMLAWGWRKARMVKRTIKGPVNPMFSASYLQAHPHARYFLDVHAAHLVARGK